MTPDLAVFNALVTIILLLILGKFAWGPLVSALDQREQSARDRVDETKREAERARQALADYESKLAGAASEIEALMNEARQNADALTERIVADAREAAQRERERAVEDIRVAKDAALSELASRSVDTAVSIAAGMLRQEVDSATHARLIQEALQQFPQQELIRWHNPTKNSNRWIPISSTSATFMPRRYSRRPASPATPTRRFRNWIPSSKMFLTTCRTWRERSHLRVSRQTTKINILDKALAGKMLTVLLNFLKVVVRHGRFDCLRAIRRAARKLHNETRGRVEVEVRTAASIEPELLETISGQLRSALGRELEMTTKVVPELIGGMVVRVGDTLYDGSVINQLNRLREKTMKKMEEEIRDSLGKFELAD